MSSAVFDGDQISHNSIAVMRGSNNPRVVTYPRTIGGIIQESGVIEKSILLKSYIIPPKTATRGNLENYFHLLNEQIGSKEGTLTVNGNSYLKANVRNINYDAKIVNNFNQFEVEFILGEQNEGGIIRQLSIPDLVDFSRGRKITFETELEDESVRTFSFWHNFDLIKNFDTQVTIKRGIDHGFTTGKVIRIGGFEKIVAQGWIIGPEVRNRQNLEAYFYNIMNGPLGRLGTLIIEGSEDISERTIEKCVLTDLSMSEETYQTLRYTLTFLTSLQC